MMSLRLKLLICKTSVRPCTCLINIRLIGINSSALQPIKSSGTLTASDFGRYFRILEIFSESFFKKLGSFQSFTVDVINRMVVDEIQTYLFVIIVCVIRRALYSSILYLYKSNFYICISTSNVIVHNCQVKQFKKCREIKRTNVVEK